MPQADLFEYIDANRLGHFEGEQGVRSLTKVITEVCGYGSPFGNPLHDFFADNSGAIEAVLNWIANQNVPEWNENMQIDDEEPEFDAEDIEWQENYIDQQRDSLINDEDIPGY